MKERTDRTASTTMVAAIAAALFSGCHAQYSAPGEARAATASLPPVNDGLPVPGFTIEKDRTAIVITDPQNDFLCPPLSTAKWSHQRLSPRCPGPAVHTNAA
jgi:hypothetical protein